MKQIYIVTSDKAFFDELSSYIGSEKSDCEVLQLSSDEEAAEAARNGMLQLAIIDTALRKTDCIRLTSMIRDDAPDAGVIFIAKHGGLAAKAYEAHVQGYIIRPVTSERLNEEIDYFFRHFAINKRNSRVEVMTRGSFECFLDGEPVRFKRRKAKAVLAYLVKKKGKMATNEELIKLLWNDDCKSLSDQQLMSRNSNIRNIRAELERTFSEAGITDILKKNWGEMAVNMDAIKIIG